VIVVTTVLVWLYDSACLVWLVKATLGHRGKPGGATLTELAPLKAASYILNILNYHAASMGMAWLIGRRKGVSFLEAAGALATLSWLDLVAVTGMAVTGLWLAPEVLGPHPALQAWLQAVAAVVFGVALLAALLLQSSWNVRILQTLRDLPPLRPLAALSPARMAQGIVLRAGMICAYAVAAMLLMRSFGMQPSWGRLFVAMPILTVVGTIPISVSGLGTTQVLMRSLYGPFVTDGRVPGPVIDAYSTAMIMGYIAARVVVAAPFLAKVSRELREKPPEL
jgi:uncharacterized membrane protein YbhN (UPF0104 family)